MRTALFDADTLIYEASLSVEYEADWGEGLWTLHSELPAAALKFDELAKEIVEKLKATRSIMALSFDGPRWRNEVMPSYKAARGKGRRPLVYRPLRQYVHDNYETFERPTLEGDDVLGILATHPTLVKGEKVIVSIDKDLKTIPGLHYNPQKDSDVREVSEEEADYYHLYQTLTGDTTDGYPGCPGVGPVGATKLLNAASGMAPGWIDNATEVWPAVVKAYVKAGLSEEVALENARVARICRATDYNFDKKEVVLWNP